MWALHDAIATSKAGFDTVETLLQDEEVALAGSGAVLARMIDNHDTPRFISVASGDAGGDPWDEPATQPGELAPYQRLEMALATLLTLPGVPVLYQGDEIGLAGGGDPDNRRVMPADEELLDAQLELRGRVARLGRLRACSETLRRGVRHALFADSRRYAYLRGIETSEPVAVAMSTATVTTTVALSLPPGIYVDALSGAPFDASEGTLALELAPLSYRVLLREGDPCLP
jgi:glycosidase